MIVICFQAPALRGAPGASALASHHVLSKSTKQRRLVKLPLKGTNPVAFVFKRRKRFYKKVKT